MCFGDGNKKLQATIDIDTSSLGGLTDILNKQPTDEEVAAEETVEATEETTAPNLLNQPVLDKLEKMSENLPERTTGETMRAMMPAIQHSDQMMHHMNRDQMRMLERIMQRTGRRPFNPRHPRGGSFGKGGGHSDPRVPRPRYQTLGANPQVAGLAGLFGRPHQHAGIRGKGINPEQIMATPTPYNFGGAQRNPSPENIAKFYEQQQMATPMQPEVVEEQQQMEILGQPKQFAGGGLVNALMATPVGQAAIKQYAEGGDIKFGDYVFDYKLTDDDPLDILRGITYDDGRKARFFSSEAHMKDPSEPVVKWRKPDVVKEITEDLKPVRRKKKKGEPHEGDSQVPGGAPSDRTAANNWGYIGHKGRGLMSVLGAATGLPLGLLGALNDYQAMNMGRTGWSTQFSPSFWDTLTMGLFDSSGMYDKTVENMENRNIAGREGLLGDPNSPLGQAKLMDYTHKYGTEEPITEHEEKDYKDLVGQVEALDPSDWDVDEAGEEGPSDPSGGDMGHGMDNSAQDSTPSDEAEETGSESAW